MLVIVAIVAGFLVYKFAQYVHVVANQSTGAQQGTPLPTADQDVDHDGLSNQQESIWNSDPFNPDSDGDGFKDGEEVNSGHNPLIPGPDDLISADNLTEQFSELTVAGLAEGSLQPDSPDYDQALADITSSIADSAKYIFSKEVNGDSIKTVETSTTADATYLERVAPQLQSLGVLLSRQFENIPNHLNIIGEKGFTDTEMKKLYSEQTNTTQTVLDAGSNISVPQNLKDAHAQFLTLTFQTHEISAAIAKGEEDPIKATFALDALGTLPEKYVSMMESYQSALEAIHFDPALIKTPAR